MEERCATHEKINFMRSLNEINMSFDKKIQLFFYVFNFKGCESPGPRK